MSDKPIPERCPACKGKRIFEWFGHAESLDVFESDCPDDRVPRNRSKACEFCEGTGIATFERLRAAEAALSESRETHKQLINSYSTARQLWEITNSAKGSAGGP